MRVINTFAMSLLLAMSAFTSADTIELKNGKKLDGKIISQADGIVTLDMDGIPVTLNTADIQSMSMGGAAEPKAAVPEATKSKTASGPIEIPAGTTMLINLGSTLDSGKHTKGHKFTAVLEGAIIHDGITAVPAGSKIYGVVTEAVKSRRASGKSKLLVTITEMNINGKIVPIQTSAINAYTQATGKSSAGKVVRGAAIGSLADGSSGAKTGAKVGLAGALLSGGNQVVIPAGTLLDFTLTQALNL